MDEFTLLIVVLTLVWFILFGAMMRSLASRLAKSEARLGELSRELRGCRFSLERLAGSVHEDSVGKAEIREPIGGDDIEEALK